MNKHHDEEDGERATSHVALFATGASISALAARWTPRRCALFPSERAGRSLESREAERRTKRTNSRERRWSIRTETLISVRGIGEVTEVGEEGEEGHDQPTAAVRVTLSPVP